MTGIPLATIALVATTLAFSDYETTVLSASDTYRVDSDLDGLSDFQEAILGTDPDALDTDDDGFTDLEEVARNANPLDDSSVPGELGVDVGMYASVRDGLVSLNSAVFVPPGELLDLSYYFGAIIEGETVVIPGNDVASGSRQWLFPARNGGHIAIVEMYLPEWMIHYAGQVSFFAGATTGDPRDPETAKKISATTLASVSNTIMSINPIATLPSADEGSDGNQDGGDTSGDGGTVGGGVWYKPLGGEDEIPSELTSGEVCVQTVQFVGTMGASDLYEVNSANCEPMDSYCSGSSCSATEGTALEMPNPGAVFGD